MATNTDTGTNLVHGIVSLNPPTVRCDGCGFTYTAKTIARAVLLSGILFSTRRYDLDPTHPDHDQRRLCATCRRTEWKDDER